MRCAEQRHSDDSVERDYPSVNSLHISKSAHKLYLVALLTYFWAHPQLGVVMRYG